MSSSKSANPSSQLTPTGGPTIIPNPPPNTLRHPVRFITTHNHTTGQAILHSSTPVPFRLYDNNNLSMGVAYTTSSFPPNLNSDADITAHTSLMSSGTLGLVNPGGTVLRCVDFAPGYACGMHRTQSLDFWDCDRRGGRDGVG
ncbi:putative E3 ubiquitin-protein [Thermochaetoides thermophila DSM 1495]|uniref:Putative E3 ubiquitin-protein n=1 Tax=Chaetomium thermophilum (strain DSM 1495 / CBS 144.50 / IMI 039719) TaxID=759272 RepID=G0SAB7_CHATD|nr:putative E3 ubiquitin-protein [Thermochaetoides thermophila DSM 1495]EGS19689.1 putative E3 ubiquitin-protein [Thermochaetoides thermophila DSM 1495]